LREAGVITEIRMAAVASYKGAASLQTDKKVNLIYGLNGTGKSTLSNFLYEPSDPKFVQCERKPGHSAAVLVYNQTFIQDTFYVADSLKGIFSLSKENKAAEQKIANAEADIASLTQSLIEKQSAKLALTEQFVAQRQRATNEVWKIKTTYTGGDRVLEYCLDGLKGQKERLFEHLLGIKKLSQEPKKSMADLRDEVSALSGETAQPQAELPLLTFAAQSVEVQSIHEKAIVGNEDSQIASVIERLGNSDWVKQGVKYLPEHIEEQGMSCPFCQHQTITQSLADQIKSYFDATYQADILALQEFGKRYLLARNNLLPLSSYTNHSLVAERTSALSKKYQAYTEILDANLRVIQEKLQKPSVIQKLSDSTQAFSAVNAELEAINGSIRKYNAKLQNREAVLNSLKKEFWSIIRIQYDQTITRYQEDAAFAEQKLAGIEREAETINTQINAQRVRIIEAQRETVNVDEAVNAINARLVDIGIDDFQVVKHSASLYKVVRSGDLNDVFHSLSEGEKMIISFLYFCELCKGRTNADDTDTQRIAVIDDPISSLSHVFIFNVGQLIRSEFFKSTRFSQVFVLTHSLYFFYELTDTNYDRRKATQKLFRMSKSPSGSKIQEMKYEEIQNDYHAYWAVINDADQPPALIANCMRNIVEYFFNFVRRKDLNNVFQMPELQDVRFQAFCRYVNRESHSLGQNIIDMKEFNYDNFKEGLRLIFEKTGYPDHFKAMYRC
jgi:wobble nucleotide-excising tRNase